MTKREKTIRIIVNGVLLAVIIALGVTLYQAGSKSEIQEDTQEQALVEEEDTTVAQATENEEAQIVDNEMTQESVNTQAEVEESVESVQIEENLEIQEDVDSSVDALEDAESQELAETSSSSIPQVDFTEETLMIWPLAGDVVMDYSMDQTVYDPTLNEYRYHPAIVISAAENSPVLSASNGNVISIEESAETGTTLTLDMGNGYETVYGQLQNVQVQEGQTVEESTILGYVASPTSYYSTQGSNLYFAMTKDGSPIDPILYLP
jgi:murein DD-endopeptidase MepM/ murein hydrolase activator NlpD